MEKLDEYFSLLTNGLMRRDCADFYERYRSAFDRLRCWTHDVDHRWLLAHHRHHTGTIGSLGEVYIRCYPTFSEQVWPDEQRRLRRSADKLSTRLTDLQLIAAWEQETGKRFHFDHFAVVFCSSSEGGPDANSLGYERTVSCSGRRPDALLQLVSHEVGTHILIDTFKALWTEGKFELYWGSPAITTFGLWAQATPKTCSTTCRSRANSPVSCGRSTAETFRSHPVNCW